MALVWHGEEAIKAIDAAAYENVQRATVFFWSKCQDELNVSAKVGKGTKGSDYQASKPGEPPRKRTGWLQRNVVYELDEKEKRGRVGLTANAMYGLFLEFGTRFMAARPWLLGTLRKYWQAIRAYLGLGGGDKG